MSSSTGRFDGTSENMRGYLRHADEKELPTDRDYRGTAQIDGKNYWVSGYKKRTKEGNRPYLRLVFKPCDE